MFVLAVEDDGEAVARLVRLMLNIEHGARLYEWAPGSTGEPHADPAPGFLTLELPGATTGAPPLSAEYRPTVGIIYYFTTLSFDPGVLARELRKRLLREDDGHLGEPLTTEVAPHASVIAEGRTYPGVDLTGPHPPYVRGWYPGTTYPTRHLHFVYPGFDLSLPLHYSLRGGFSWYILPAAALARLRRVGRMPEFNALVASILFDTERRPSTEPAEPVYERPQEHLRVPPLPPPVARALAGAPAEERGAPPLGDPREAWPGGPPGQGVILLHVGDHFEVAGLVLREFLAGWAPPPAAPEGGPLADLNLVEADRCTFCWLPLWGEFYAASFPDLAPHRAPVCRWCYGLFPHALPAPGGAGGAPGGGTVRATHPRGIVEAFDRPEYGYLRPALGVPARRVPLAARGGRPVFIVEGAEGGWLLDPTGGPGAADPYLCLSAPELAGWRLPSAEFARVAERLAVRA
jgi:hypothetical protein